MTWVAVGVGGATLIGGAMSAEGGKKAGRAAGRAANEQLYEARRAYGETKSIVEPATVAGLAAFDRDIANQEKNLARQEQLISQIDPTIIEASQQALRLLRGEESKTLSPFKNQRAMQRQKLVNSLREQLGPGAETSTAGIQALTRFDSETDSLFAGAQQQALGNVASIFGQFNSGRPDMLREITGLSQFGQGKTQLQYQKAAALSNARMGMQQAAGGQFLGAQLAGNQQQAFGNQILGAATQYGTAALLRGGSKPTPDDPGNGDINGESGGGSGIAGPNRRRP